MAVQAKGNINKFKQAVVIVFIALSIFAVLILINSNVVLKSTVVSDKRASEVGVALCIVAPDKQLTTIRTNIFTSEEKALSRAFEKHSCEYSVNIDKKIEYYLVTPPNEYSYDSYGN